VADKVPSTIALWKPFTDSKGTTALTHDIICVHTMVGSLAGSWNWANGDGRSYWHFGTSGTGECWQCHDLRYRSAANLNGNWRVIPIENADMGPGFGAWSGNCGDVPSFTAAQVDKLVDLIEWLCRRYNIPPALIPDTRAGRRGIAYHRQGIDPWRCDACEKWSSSAGKCCPDWRRINQLTGTIIPRVKARLSAPTKDWFDMATEAQLKAIVDKAVANKVLPRRLVREGYVAGDPLYDSDLLTYKVRVDPVGGKYDQWIKGVLAINGISTTAIRLPQAVLDEIPEATTAPPS
jgi:hypothetical protein